MNDEQVLKRKCQRFIVESDSDDDNQMIDLKDEEICQCFFAPARYKVAKIVRSYSKVVL
jgi:hypothetical protein